MKSTEKAACHRGDGEGRLPQFSNVIGGVCFLCKGSGKSKARPGAKRSIRFAVSACELSTGKRLSMCYIRARSAEQALRIARVQLASGNGYDPSTAQVEPA